jgi:hypothetical protein
MQNQMKLRESYSKLLGPDNTCSHKFSQAHKLLLQELEYEKIAIIILSAVQRRTPPGIG